MEKVKLESELCDYLGELGLGGCYWFVGDDESLFQALSDRLASEVLHTGVPDAPSKLDQCSVLIFRFSDSPLNEEVLAQLEGSNSRPIVILLDNTSLPDSIQDRFQAIGYKLPPVLPKGRTFHVIESVDLSHKKHFNVAGYWEKRYASGRNSGAGSYGRLARFKAQFLNYFVKKNKIQTVLEIGCGDGAQLSLADYPQYTGLDISRTIIQYCLQLYSHDSSKRFEVYDPKNFSPDSVQAELVLSLDVIYHLSNDEVYEKYLEHLFLASTRFVIIYSNSNRDQGDRLGINESAGYVRLRDVLDDVEKRQPEWCLVDAVPNSYPFSAVNPSNTSFADFFVFEKRSEGEMAERYLAGIERFASNKILNTLMVFDENSKSLSDNVSSANKKIDALIKEVRKLDSEQNLQEKLNQANQAVSLLQDKLEAAREELHVAYVKCNEDQEKLQKLENKLSAAEAGYQEVMANYQDISSRYRVAYAKYRDVCQQLSVVKSSNAYKAGLYIRAASSSFKDVIKLPVRLWRLKKQKKNQPKQRMSLKNSLRYIKWKVVVPLAMRIGVPYRKVARLNFPQPASFKHLPMAQHTQSRGSATQQPEAFTPPSSVAEEISILGWPEHPPNGKPYVIGIMDEFTTGCFEQDVNLIQPRPDNWYALAEKYKPEFFFIESAWKGNYGSWQYRVADYANKPGQEIAHICQYAREKGIPTLFWNKEDPVHHQKFMCSAKLVDHIFTTDANMKDSYQAKTGNPNVHAMPFAAQPALHKPAPLAGRKPRACFAGSWYGNRHAERGESMRWLLQAANRHGLDIYDRNHGTGIFPFPEEYQAGIKGSLPYKELCDEYSRYRVFLNVNSVTDSPTMFSRRVFELMACGTPVVSTYAKGIENLFETDAVWLVHSQEEADEALHTLMTDDAEWRRRSLAGIREVFAKHTYAHRLNDIFDRLGIETRMATNPAIGLVAAAHSQAELQALDQFARQQSYRGFQLGIACAPGLAQLAGSLSENITLLQCGQKAPWLAEQHAESPLAGWLCPQHRYGEHYLRDLVNASLYEPEAAGWAKAMGQDRFAYAGEACLGGSLWRSAEFLKQPLKAHPEERITRPDLYLADSDQFQAAGAAQQVVGG